MGYKKADLYYCPEHNGVYEVYYYCGEERNELYNDFPSVHLSREICKKCREKYVEDQKSCGEVNLQNVYERR